MGNTPLKTQNSDALFAYAKQQTLLFVLALIVPMVVATIAVALSFSEKFSHLERRQAGVEISRFLYPLIANINLKLYLESSNQEHEFSDQKLWATHAKIENLESQIGSKINGKIYPLEIKNALIEYATKWRRRFGGNFDYEKAIAEHISDSRQISEMIEEYSGLTIDNDWQIRSTSKILLRDIPSMLHSIKHPCTSHENKCKDSWTAEIKATSIELNEIKKYIQRSLLNGVSISNEKFKKTTDLIVSQIANIGNETDNSAAGILRLQKVISDQIVEQVHSKNWMVSGQELLFWTLVIACLMASIYFSIGLFGWMKKLELTINESNNEIRIASVAFESQEGMMIIAESGEIIRVNEAFCTLTGYSYSDLNGKKQDDLEFLSFKKDEISSIWGTLMRTGSLQQELEIITKDHIKKQLWMSASSVVGDSGDRLCYVATFFDISEKKSAADTIAHLAFHDFLTTLPNRRMYVERLTHALQADARGEKTSAIMFIDIDGFKIINDVFGHTIGDKLLMEISKRLQNCVREYDTVARLGGDEFAIILENFYKENPSSITGIKQIAEKILESISRPCTIENQRYEVTASIGIYLASEVDDIADVMKKADFAMYQAKESGKNSYSFFDYKTQQSVLSRNKLETDLRDAINEHQFQLVYQPQVKSNGVCIGYEALVRWHHPTKGVVPPNQFIPLAEETGQIIPIGDWVLQTACEQLREWSMMDDTKNLTISVNVSARQIKQLNFVENVLDCLKKSKADPRLLKLELTETMFMGDFRGIVEKMQALKSHGVSFSMDDFGTGFSSLSYLKNLPLDQIKVDKSFLDGMLTDERDAAIVRAIISVGQSLGMIVVAEGVETCEQRDFLEINDCDLYQGYFYGKPGPIRGVK